VTARLFFDEHIDLKLVSLLQPDERFDVLTTQAAGRANRALSDESQLMYATEDGRAIFTHNIKDFVPLARQWAAAGRHHSGILWSEAASARELAARLRAWVIDHPDGLLADMQMRLP
jgi:hypothetical protein